MTTRLIPREVLFGNPEKASPAISPDGRRVAWLAPVDGVLNVWVGHLGAGDAAPVTGDRERGVRDYRWAHDDRHLLYVQDRGGDEDWHLYAVDLDNGETRDLTPFDGVQAQLVADGKRFPDRVLVGLNKDNPQLHDVYRVELGSGELELVASNPGFVGWLADAELRVRCGVAATPDGGLRVMVRGGAGGGRPYGSASRTRWAPCRSGSAATAPRCCWSAPRGPTRPAWSASTSPMVAAKSSTRTLSTTFSTPKRWC